MRVRLADKQFSRRNTYHVNVGELFSLANPHLLLTFRECIALSADLLACGLTATANEVLEDTVCLTTPMRADGCDGGDIFSGYQAAM